MSLKSQPILDEDAPLGKIPGDSASLFEFAKGARRSNLT